MPRILGGPYTRDNGKEGSIKLGRDGTRTLDASLIYLVEGDTNNDDVTNILENTPNLPRAGDLVGGIPCIEASAQEIQATSRLWEVTCRFDSGHFSGSGQSGSDPVDPPDLFPEWSWSTETEDRIVEQDIYGYPIVNSAEEPFDVSAPWPIPVLTITRYYDPTFNTADVILNYSGKLNELPFWGFPKGLALMADVSDQGYDAGGKRWRKVSFTIKFRTGDFGTDNTIELNRPVGDRIGWQGHYLNYGTRYWDTTNQKYVTKTDDKGNQIGVYLAPNGTESEPDINGDIEKYYHYYEYREYINFNDLNLGPFV